MANRSAEFDVDAVILPQVRCTEPTPCGACCMHVVTPPFSPFEPHWVWLALMYPELVLEIESDARARRVVDRLPCLWFDAATSRCKHYELRPDVCRGFVPGSVDCARFRYVRGIGEEEDYLPVIGWVRCRAAGPNFGEERRDTDDR